MTMFNNEQPATPSGQQRPTLVVALLVVACILLAALVAATVWGVFAVTGAIDDAVCDLQYTGDTVALALCKS